MWLRFASCVFVKLLLVFFGMLVLLFGLMALDFFVFNSTIDKFIESLPDWWRSPGMRWAVNIWNVVWWTGIVSITCWEQLQKRQAE